VQGKAFVLLIIGVLGHQCPAAHRLSMEGYQFAALTRSIPPRPPQALTGSHFAAIVSRMDLQQREQAILDEVLQGNLPSFLRRLIPVQLKHELGNGKTLTATIFVMPDYLAIGSDSDFLRIPADRYTATAIADRFGFVLPTQKMVDAIYDQSSFHLKPKSMVPGLQMRSTEYYRIHNQMIEEQCRAGGIQLGELISGHKKDVVVTNLLAGKEGRIAIYGWHRSKGDPIQPLSIVHVAHYADYSHGIRLISKMAMVDGKVRSIYDVLQDPLLAKVLSDEGSIRNLEGIMALASSLRANPSELHSGQTHGSGVGRYRTQHSLIVGKYEKSAAP